jgi:hypothetical protein
MISSHPTTGTGMLAVFCDLEPKWHREFREWLRDDMMPARMRIGFPAAASYDRIEGARDNSVGIEPFVTAYETASHGDLYGAPYQALRVDRDQRDKDFHARFIAPARYTLAWLGPELATPGQTGFSPVAVFDRIDLPEAAIQDFNIAYWTRSLPVIAGVRGLVRARRYLAMEGHPRHILVHEFAEPAALDDPAWREARDALTRHLPPGARRTSGAYRCVLSATP